VENCSDLATTKNSERRWKKQAIVKPN